MKHIEFERSEGPCYRREIVGLLLLLPMVIIGTGCARLSLRGEFNSIGNIDLAKEKAVEKEYERLIEKQEKAPSQVQILIDAIPEGINISDGIISVDKNYNHSIIGKFSIKPEKSLFFEDYKDKWRKGLCYWQIPLVLATEFIWGAMPTFYPCYATSYNSIDDIVNSTRKIAYAAGGDLAIMFLQHKHPRKRNQAVGAFGYIVKLDPAMKRETIQQQQLRFVD